MILGIPCKDKHEYTQALVASLVRTVKGAFGVVIVDNGSTVPYTAEMFGRVPFPLVVERNRKNRGFYQPVQTVDAYLRSQFEPLALVHNDVLFYEKGWDVRITEAFAADPQLGLIGLCGSWKIDALGGRGDGTMCYFRGEKGQSQAAGERITDLRPALVLDSLFMCFRQAALRHIQTDDLPLAHFYDKIWPCQVIDAGWRVAVLGSEIDHYGGITAADFDAFEADAKAWCKVRGLEAAVGDDGKGGQGPCWGLTMYLEAERRFLSEWRDRRKFFPCWVDREFRIHPDEAMTC